MDAAQLLAKSLGRPVSTHPVDVGLRTEAIITAELVRRGISVLQPCGFNRRYRRDLRGASGGCRDRGGRSASRRDEQRTGSRRTLDSRLRSARLAQLVEHSTCNGEVLGSSPRVGLPSRHVARAPPTHSREHSPVRLLSQMRCSAAASGSNIRLSAGSAASPRAFSCQNALRDALGGRALLPGARLIRRGARLIRRSQGSSPNEARRCQQPISLPSVRRGAARPRDHRVARCSTSSVEGSR